MKNRCPCPKKPRRKAKSKTPTKIKQAMKPTALYNKFAGVTAPMLANTSGTFNIPGFAPIKSFPYPGLTVGNASQMDGLLPGSGRADMIAANMYRAQDRRDDVASGLGVTGLKSAVKGSVSGRKVNLTNPNESIIPDTTVFQSFSDDSFRSPRSSRSNSLPNLESIPVIELSPFFPLMDAGSIKKEQQEEKARQQGMRAANFQRYNRGLGDSKDIPLNVPDGVGAPFAPLLTPARKSSRVGFVSQFAFSPQPLTGRNP
jgi:hypothetical protein